MIIGCKPSRIDIVDHYKVYRYSEVPPTPSDEFVLMCKLGGEDDPYIPNVSNIQLSEKYMIVQTSEHFYFIDGSENKICCMCQNKTLGPYNNSQIQSIKDSINFRPTKKFEVMM